ncbi:MAG: protein-glutamate O-methyltransferase CheR, partial [Rhodospirillales bacterium]|nr:protein-glutamate O-methyltransferase CheR [Rhodospirillales bacterium]
PDLIERRGTTKAFRIWWAAASSGQEPYSLAIILKEAAARLAGWRHEIVGTDISKDILAKASAGIYSQFEVQRGLPIQFLIKYFDKMEDQWQIKPDIRNMVTYKYFNLLDNLTPLGRFDIVFCRNVLIYFDAETKGKVLSCIADLMPEDGLLFLGGAETVLGISERFRPVKGKRGVYEKVS